MVNKKSREEIVNNLKNYPNLVGFDLDGTLNDLAAYQTEHARKFFGKAPINPNVYDIEDMYQCSHFVRQLFWLRYIWKYCLKYAPREDAVKVINRIIDLDLVPCLITARVYVMNQNAIGSLFRNMVYKWLKEEEIAIDADKVVFCSEKYSAIEKADYCGKLKIRWMFEDKPDNVLMISQITKTHVLCPTSPYNKMITTGGNITVIDSLSQGLDVIEQELKSSGGYQYVK